MVGLQTGGGRERKQEGRGGEVGYKIANFIVHMWIKFPPLKMLRNAHVPITPWCHRRELWGHVLDVLAPVCARVCQIVCGQHLCLLWFSAKEASKALGTLTPTHQYTGTEWVSKMTQLEDGNVFWQALPGGMYLKLPFSLFPLLFSLVNSLYLFSVFLCLFPGIFATSCAVHSGWLWRCDYVHMAWHPPFVCFFQLSTSQHFSSIQIRGDWFWLRKHND